MRSGAPDLLDTLPSAMRIAGRSFISNPRMLHRRIRVPSHGDGAYPTMGLQRSRMPGCPFDSLLSRGRRFWLRSFISNPRMLHRRIRVPSHGDGAYPTMGLQRSRMPGCPFDSLLSRGRRFWLWTQLLPQRIPHRWRNVNLRERSAVRRADLRTAAAGLSSLSRRLRSRVLASGIFGFRESVRHDG